MTNYLEDILTILEEDRQLSFLKEIKNKDSEIKEILINKFRDENTIIGEAETSKQSQDICRYEELAKLSVDVSMEEKPPQFFQSRPSLSEIVLMWRDPTITTYALDRVDSFEELDKTKLRLSKCDALSETVRFTKELESETIHKQQLEKLFSQQKEDDKPCAQTIEQLGRFDEAITEYLIEGGFYLEEEKRALELAKEHNPERVREIMEQVVERFRFDRNIFQIDFYLTCANFIGKEREVKEKIRSYAKNTKHTEELCRLIPILVKQGLIKDARKGVKKIIKKERSYYLNEEIFIKKISDLYCIVGEPEKAVELLENERKKFGSSKSYIIKGKKVEILSKLAELKKDYSILDEVIPILLEERDYEGCSKIEELRGNSEKSKLYLEMHRLTQ